MYKVIIVNDNIETVIHNPHINGVKLETGTIKKEINKIDSFNMSFFLNNPAYGKLKPFKTFVNVFNTKTRSEEHTSELQSRGHLVCRLLLEKKKNIMCEFWAWQHMKELTSERSVQK